MAFQAGTVAQIISLQGQVWIENGAAAHALLPSTPLLPGMQLSTGEDGALLLQLKQGQQLLIGARQHLTLDADVLAGPEADISEWALSAFSDPLQLAQQLQTTANSLSLDALLEHTVGSEWPGNSPSLMDNSLSLDDSSLLHILQQLKNSTPPEH